MPRFRFGIEIRKCAFVKRHGNGLFLTRFKEHLFESFKLLFGTENGAVGIGNVHLRNLRAGCISDIFDLKRHFKCIGVFYILF